MKISLKKLILASSLFLISQSSIAALISPDLMISGSAEFDTVDSIAATGNVVQSADMEKVIGGVLTTTSVLDLTTTGDNPLGGTFTDTGDGIGIDASVSGTSGEADDFIFDFAFNLANNSLTDTYEVFFSVSFDNLANADGDDSFIDSELNLFNSGLAEIFFSDLTSDTFFGDEQNGIGLATSGAELTDAGTFGFSISLAAGASDSFSGILKMDGGIFGQTGQINAMNDVFISVSEVRNTTTPPPTIPEPASILLFLTASLGLLARKSLFNN